MATRNVVDKRVERIGRRLAKVGLSLKDGKVVCVCPTCGQEVAVENKPIAVSRP